MTGPSNDDQPLVGHSIADSHGQESQLAEGGSEMHSATMIFLRCSARYGGRIEAELEIGDRILVLFDHGAAILHGLNNGVKPLNWMPIGSTFTRDEAAKLIVLENARGERLEIFYENIWHEHRCSGQLHGRLVKLGSEKECSDMLAENLDLIGEGLTLVAREYRTAVGPIDLLVKKPSGWPVVIEVKRNRVTGSEVLYQIQRYIDAIEQMQEWSMRPEGVLVAPALSRAGQRLAEQMNIRFVRVRFDEINAESSPST